MEKNMKKILWAILLSSFAATPTVSASLSQTCARYFAEMDVYFSELPSDQAATLKKQYEANKEKLSYLPERDQEQTCSHALDKLNSYK